MFSWSFFGGEAISIRSTRDTGIKWWNKSSSIYT